MEARLPAGSSYQHEGRVRFCSSLIICHAHTEAISGEKAGKPPKWARGPLTFPQPRGCDSSRTNKPQVLGNPSTCPHASIPFRSCLPGPFLAPRSRESFGEKTAPFRDKSLLEVRISFPGDWRHLVPIVQAPTHTVGPCMPHPFPKKAAQCSPALQEGAGASSGARVTTGAFRKIMQTLPCQGKWSQDQSCQ